MSLSLAEALELVSNRLLLILEKIEKLEKHFELNAKQEALLSYTKEQSMLRTALVISLYNNFEKYKKDFATDEVQKTYKFCQITEKKLLLLEKELKEE